METKRIYPETYYEDAETWLTQKKPTYRFSEIYGKILTAFDRINEEYNNGDGANIFLEDPITYHDTHRYRDIKTVKQPEFPNYPAAKIKTSDNNEKFDVIAEGPYFHTLPRLLNSLKQLKVSVLIPVGDSLNGKKFDNYMGNSKNISLEAFFKNASHLMDLPEQLKMAAKTTNFKFYCYSSEEYGDFYIMHIPNWEDHGMPKFNTEDKIVLGYFCEAGKNACYHCSAGVGRSVAVIMIKMFYQNLYKIKKEITLSDVLNYFVKAFVKIKEVKPGAGIGMPHQILIAPGLAEDLYHLIKPTLEFKDTPKLENPYPVTTNYDPSFHAHTSKNNRSLPFNDLCLNICDNLKNFILNYELSNSAIMFHKQLGNKDTKYDTNFCITITASSSNAETVEKLTTDLQNTLCDVIGKDNIRSTKNEYMPSNFRCNDGYEYSNKDFVRLTAVTDDITDNYYITISAKANTVEDFDKALTQSFIKKPEI